MKTTRAVLALGVGLTVLLTACTATGTQESTAAGITVKRDGYGIPHVYADTTRALYSGYGYSVAEDRLFQMEMAKRSSVGTAAEVLGPDYVEIDKTARAASIRRRSRISSPDCRRRNATSSTATPRGSTSGSTRSPQTRIT